MLPPSSSPSLTLHTHWISNVTVTPQQDVPSSVDPSLVKEERTLTERLVDKLTGRTPGPANTQAGVDTTTSMAGGSSSIGRTGGVTERMQDLTLGEGERLHGSSARTDVLPEAPKVGSCVRLIVKQGILECILGGDCLRVCNPCAPLHC